MAPTMNHRPSHHQTRNLHQRRPAASPPLNIHRRQLPPPTDSNYACFPPQYLPYPRQLTAENAARFWYLHQESIEHLQYMMMMNPSSSSYDSRYSLPPRFMQNNNSFFHDHCPIFPVDETLLLDNLTYQILPLYHDQSPSRIENRTISDSTNHHSVIAEEDTLLLDIVSDQRLPPDHYASRIERRHQNRTISGSPNQNSVLTEDETLILNLSEYTMPYDEGFRRRADGLSEETIVKHMKTRDTRIEDNDKVCVVCQINLLDENKKIGTLNCKHEYHAECIKKWLSVKNDCPLCKATGLIVD